MNQLTIILILALVLCGISPVGAHGQGTVSSLHMDSVTLESNGDVNFTGHIDSPNTVWFVYGAQPDVYSAGTGRQNLTAATSLSATISDGYFPGQTIYARLANISGYSSEEQSLVIAALTPRPTTTFGSHVENITKSDFDLLIIMGELPSAFADHVGAPTHDLGMLIFWAFVFSCMFIVLYMRAENVMTPALLGLVIGWVLLTFVPGEFRMMGQALLVIGLGALIFTIIKGRIR